jgi:ribose 5-phosphate isomerase B
MIFIGADHRGFELKEKVILWLKKEGHDIEDQGAYMYDPADDYPEFSEKVASLVKEGNDLGILICGSGVGVEVVANKFDGVRAGIGLSPEQVKKGREDDDMNVLVIASDFTNEEESLKMVEAFIKTKYQKSGSHERRLNDIEKLEANN